MKLGKVRIRMPLRAWILLVSGGLHGIAALALLAAGPLLAGLREPDPVPDHVVMARPTEVPDLPPIVVDEQPVPDWILEDQPDPEESLDIEETVDPEMEIEVDEDDFAGFTPGDEVIGIGAGRIRGRFRHPHRRLRPEPEPQRTPARMVARSGLRFSLADVKSAATGTLKLAVKIGPDGKVTDVVVRRRSGVVSFDETVQASVSHWRFEPARVDGEAVASSIELSLSPARSRTTPKPQYPSRAVDLNLEGVVRLAAVVGRDGSVTEVKVIESSGKGLLDRAAIAAVKKWTFHPARVNGRPAPCTVEIRPIRFQLQ